MTDKDYKLIANALQEAVLHPNLNTDTLNVAIAWLAIALKKDNPKFEEKKFRKACGLIAMGR